ncbi:hypothetical protein HGRIS_010096 [Hohenbuehelia grisea]|uniref:Glutamyl-tRNA(Gln) amidotransferase subunit B, mitochondrial n=1 Tax=Hohenbuehelia grisea TaxID=104357 RepID=A0ABR3J4P6_9AGAR
MLSSLRHGLSPLNILRRRRLHTRRGDLLNRWPGWEVVIGIEVHAQIRSRAKLFSDTLTSELGQPANTHVSAFDAAFPGTLPRLNHKCVDLAVRTAVALNSNVQRSSSFDRKHYFYFDLPAGYQITQHYAPVSLGGYLKIDGDIPIRIKQIQLEQDTAKLIVEPRTRTPYIDFNRAGSALMEIVSEPDLTSPEEASNYVIRLQRLLRAIGSCDGSMEKGSLRCDVNVSVNRPGSPPGTRCEIKNLNSIKFMYAAIKCEIQRHISILNSSPHASVPQETRGFNEDTFETFKLRSKEDAPDYRYMPDMNLGVLRLTEDYIQGIRQTMPELPDAAWVRLQQRYSLSDAQIAVLLAFDSEKEIPYDGEAFRDGPVAYFERVAALTENPRVACNWVTNELVGQLTARRETYNDNTVTAEQLAELINLVRDKILTRSSGQQLLRYMLDNPSQTASPTELAHKLDLIAMSHSSGSASATMVTPAKPAADLHALCVAAIEGLPSEAEAFRRGNKNVLNKIVGHVMRASRGRADALAAKQALEELLNDHQT